MPMTHSGVLVTPENANVPTLLDIALGLSRQPRFAGQCRRWWTVLDHSLFAAELAARDGESDRTVLAVLLHDAHEALTGDIPTSLKTEQQRAVQRALDIRIATAYFPGGPAAFARQNDQIKKYDQRALCAEAVEIGPPPLKLLSSKEFRSHFGALPRVRDCEIMRELLSDALVGRPEVIELGVEAPNVRQYVEMCAMIRASLA